VSVTRAFSCPPLLALLCGLSLVSIVSPTLAASADEFDEKAAISYSQAAIGRTIGDFTLLDTHRAPVQLSQYRGKPLVITMIYTGCTQACPLIVQTLYRTIETAQTTIGKGKFNVLTVGFDATADTPERMRAYAKSQGIELPGWTFLSGDSATIDRLSADLGFIFFPSPKGFDHLAQTTVIDGDGVIYRQIYGSDFDPPAVIEPLKDLLYGRPNNFATLSGLINRVRLLCTIYDPTTRRYVFSYTSFVGMGFGAFSLTVFGVLIARMWLRDHKRQHDA